MIRYRASFLSLQAGRLLLLLLLLAVVGGCLPTKERLDSPPLADPGRDSYNTARLSCFLTLKESEGPAVRLEVSRLEILVDDLWLPITTKAMTIDSAAIGDGQFFLGGRAVPPGQYYRLRLTVTKGSVKQPDGRFVAITKEPLSVEMNLTAALNLEPTDSRSLFVTWDVLKSLETANTLRPALTAAPSLRQMPIDLVFVACPDIDTVFVVRSDSNWVVDSFSLTGRPTYMAIDPDPSRQRLYILASREKMVKVVDLLSYRVVDYFQVPLNDAPTFMTVSPDGQGAFLLDERSGYLSRMDLATGRSVARVQLGFRPKFAAFLDGQNLLAISLSLSQKVLLLDPLSLAVVGTISTGSEPQGLLVSNNQLYIAESGDSTVSIVDLARMGTQDRLSVGFGPRRLIEMDNRIYVSNYENGSLSVLVPGQLGVIQEIHGLGRPLEMVIDQFYRRLYVADEEAAALGVIDVNTNQLLRFINLGAKPSGLVVIQ